MKRTEFKRLLENRILCLDGATGTNLMAAGMPLGVCPEQWILEHPETLIDLQVSFLEAGTNILYAPTFTCNRIKLKEYHLEDRTSKMNRQLVQLSKEAVRRCNERGYVAGDMTMTGRQLYPIGDLPFEELVDVYKEQAAALLEAGVDLIVVETMMSLQESRAALIAIRELSEDIPVIVSLTFREDGKTLFGSTAGDRSRGPSGTGCGCRGSELFHRSGGDDTASCGHEAICHGPGFRKTECRYAGAGKREIRL